jgi:flagellar protein FlbD
MISLTRLNGHPVLVNCDLIESVEESDGTIVTLTTGSVLIVRDRTHEIEEKVVAFKRKIGGKPERDG